MLLSERMAMPITLVSLLALFGASVAVWAGEPVRGEPVHSEPVNDAIGVFITPRGQKWVHDRFEEILFRNGYSFREGAFPEWVYSSEDAIQLDRLPRKLTPFQAKLVEIRDLLKRYLTGFRLNDPRLEIRAEDLRYKAELRRLGLRTDLPALRKLGVEHGLVLALEIEIPKIRLDVGAVRVGDLANEYLGHIGIRNFGTWLDKKSKALKLDIPVLIELDRKNGLRIRGLPVQTNLNSVHFAYEFRRPLELPKIEVIVNGYRMTLNQTAIEEDLLRYQDSIVAMLQKFMKEKAETGLPELITSTIDEFLESRKGEVMDVNLMDPPGAPRKVTPSEKFRWGVIPEELSHDQKMLSVAFSAWVDDPLASRSPRLPRNSSSRAPIGPGLTDLGPYDAALALNQGFLNRMLQLSFERGYFKKVVLGTDEDGNPETIQLAAMPEFRFESEARDHAKMKILIHQKPSGFFESLAIRGYLPISFDLDVKFQPTGPGKLKLVMDHIDEETVEVDRSRIRMFEGKVLRTVRGAIHAKNVEMQRTRKSLVDQFPVPGALLGVPLRLENFEVTKDGYLMLFINFGEFREKVL